MAECYAFGEYRLEPKRRRLLRNGKPVALEPKPFDVLQMLVEDAPYPVQKDQLFRRFWDGMDSARQANLLNQAVHLIRNALNDTRKPRRFVETRPGFGYEFIEKVSKEDASSVLTVPVSPALTEEMPAALSLSTKKINPQWADFRDYTIPYSPPWTLKCTISTESAYFRFGFKCLGPNGRVLGDGSIQSQDANLVVHVGRNYWDRPGITRRDLFYTAYANARSLDDDRRLFRSAKQLTAAVELRIDRGYVVHLLVNGESCFSHVAPPEICSRVVILAWGDRDEYSVDVTGLCVEALKGPAKH